MIITETIRKRQKKLPLTLPPAKSKRNKTSHSTLWSFIPMIGATILLVDCCQWWEHPFWINSHAKAFALRTTWSPRAFVGLVARPSLPDNTAVVTNRIASGSPSFMIRGPIQLARLVASRGICGGAHWQVAIRQSQQFCRNVFRFIARTKGL